MQCFVFPLSFLRFILNFNMCIRAFNFKHLLWILPFFVPQIMIESYCYCFKCFFVNQAPSSVFSWDVQPFHIYQQEPETVMHNKDNNITIIWDIDRTMTANRPDIVVKDLANSTCKLIVMTIPSDRNIALKEMKKKSKYKDLEVKIQRTWHI